MGHLTRLTLACLALALGHAAAANAADRDPDDRERLVTAQRLAIEGQPARAESLLRVVIGTDSSRAEALFALNLTGKIRFREKEYRRAVDAFERRLSLSPADPEALYWLGLAHRELGEPRLALPALRQAAELEPGRGDRLLFLGLTLVELEMWEEAEAALTRCVATDSVSGQARHAWRLLAMLYEETGRQDEARELRRRFLPAPQRQRHMDSPLPPLPSTPARPGAEVDAGAG